MIAFLKFIKPYVREHKRPFLLSNLFILLGACTQIGIPLYIQQVIDIIYPRQAQNEIFIAFIILVILAFIDYVANLGMRMTGVYFARNTIESIRRDVFRKLHQQELEYYDKESTGQLLARTMDDVFYLQDVLSWAWRIVATLIAISSGIIVVMFLTSPELALIFALTYPILLIVLKTISSRNAQIFYDSRYKFGVMADTMAENLSGIKTVKSFGSEEQQINLFKSKNNDYIAKANEQVRVRSYLRPGMISLYSIAVVSFLFSGGLFLESNLISTGVFVSFMYLILKLTQQMRFLGFLGIDIMIADSSAKRLNEILQYPLVLEDEPDAIKLDSINGKIEFDNVSFKYIGNDYYSLENVSLTINPGEKVALLGPTGSGKTTLVNLIPRFYDPTEGKILIDGIDIKTVTRQSLRDYIQIVHQDNFLYTVSLFENISFGKTESDLGEVIEYASASQIHKFIDSLDKKYETIVGERGVTLSGGQRQRTTIARGLLIKPKIIIFDDSVSAVDPDTEARIQETLSKIDEEITLIIISQRPSSLKYVDRIIVLDEGQVIQSGTHSELIKEENGLYSRFVNSVKKQVKFIDWDKSVSEGFSGTSLPSGD